MALQPSKSPAPFLQQEWLVFLIHTFLSHKDTAKTSRVCHLWKRVANNPQIWINENLERVFFPNLSIIDESAWQTYVDCPKSGLSATLSPKDRVTAKINAIVVMKKFNAQLKVEKNQGFTLLTIPEGLTLNILKKVAKSPMKGNGFDLDDSALSYYSEQFGKTAVSKTYQIVMTNNVVLGSKGKHIAPLVEHYKKCRLEIPKVIEIAALCTMTYLISSSSLRLLPSGEVHTICSDKVVGKVIIAGDFQEKRRNKILNCEIPAHFRFWTYLEHLSFVKEDIGIAVMKTVFPA